MQSSIILTKSSEYVIIWVEAFRRILMARFTPTDIVSQYSAIAALNANFDAVATLLELCLLRDGTSPNQMLAALNMNNFKIQNVADAVDATDAVNKGQLDLTIDAVQADADAAEASATAAAASAAQAAIDAAAVAAAVTTSGTYSPTTSTLGNLSSASINKASYIRVGNIVTVSFFGTFGGMTSENFASFLMTLPIASNLGATTDVRGSGATQDGEAVIISGNAAGDKAECAWFTDDTGGGSITGIFQYEVL
jgi:hypothetical protein